MTASDNEVVTKQPTPQAAGKAAAQGSPPPQPPAYELPKLFIIEESPSHSEEPPAYESAKLIIQGSPVHAQPPACNSAQRVEGSPLCPQIKQTTDPSDTTTTITDEKLIGEKNIDALSYVSDQTDCCCYIPDDSLLAPFFLCRWISKFFVTCGKCTEACCEGCLICMCDNQCPNIRCGQCQYVDGGHCYCFGKECGKCDCTDCVHCMFGCTDCCLFCNLFGCLKI